MVSLAPFDLNCDGDWRMCVVKESVKMYGTIEETRNLLLEIRDDLLHSDVETGAIEIIDLAISKLNELEAQKRLEDEKADAEICIQILSTVIRRLPAIQSFIESLFS